MAFNANGSRLVSGSLDGTARVWQLGEAKFPEVSMFGEHTGAVAAVAFSSDATQVVSGSANVKVWTAATGALVRDFPSKAAVVGVAFTANNQQVVATSIDKMLRVLNVADGKTVRSIAQQQAPTRLAITRDANRVAVARADNSVAVHNLANGALVTEMTGHSDTLHSMAFSPDGSRLVSGDPQRCIIWNAANGRLLEALTMATGLTAATFGPANDKVVLATEDAGLAQHSLHFAAALGDMTQAVTGLGYRADGQVLYCSSLDGTVRGFLPAGGRQTFAANHAAPVHALAISGATLASGGEDKVVKLWNSSNGAALPNGVLPELSAPIVSMTFSPDGAKLVATSASEGEVNIYSVVNRELEQKFVEHTATINSIVVCDDNGVNCVVSTSPGGVLFWELAALRRLAGHSMPVTAVAAIPGKTLQVLSGSHDGTVRHWNLQTGQNVRTMNHGGPVTGVAVRPDGQRFASTGENGRAQLWNAANGQSLAELTGDVRLRTELARQQQEQSRAASKLTANDTDLKAAQADAPTKAAAAKAATDILTAANNDVAVKQTALEKAAVTKAAAEKTAVEAAAKAQLAMAAKLATDRTSAAAAAAAGRAADRATRAASAARVDAENKELA